MSQRSQREAPAPRSLQADAALAANIRSNGKDSIAYRHTRDGFIDLVVGTLTNMDANGRLLLEVQRQCHVQLPPLPRDWYRHSKAVFFCTARVAVPKFMETHILDGRWVPEGGATLRTCCVRAGLYTFIDEYRAFRREDAHHHEPIDDNTEPLPAPTPPSTYDPATIATDRHLLSQLFSEADSRALEILALTADGWTQPEIAERLGLDVAVVARKLRKLRRTARARMEKVPQDDAAER